MRGFEQSDALFVYISPESFVPKAKADKFSSGNGSFSPWLCQSAFHPFFYGNFFIDLSTASHFSVVFVTAMTQQFLDKRSRR